MISGCSKAHTSNVFTWDDWKAFKSCPSSSDTADSALSETWKYLHISVHSECYGSHSVWEGKKRRFWVQFSALHPSLPCCTNLHHSGVFHRIFMQTQIILCHMGMVTLLLTNPHIFWRFILRLKCYDFGSNSNKRRKANEKKKPQHACTE